MFEGSTIPSILLEQNPIIYAKDEKMFCKQNGKVIPTIKMFSPRILVNRQNSRRRRKGEVTNPANTLDGLVAKRIVDGSTKSLMKHYLSEKEAIEAPSEHQELLRSEADPDVSTRTCSICGYQGKWVSEMIRHKRVHTNERPFRCKYCSRTSKWKADLIRHVAKTHGIRVVSKYSRSKAFEASLNEQKSHESSESDISEKQEILSSTSNESDNIVTEGKSSSSSKAVSRTYKCTICFFEQDSLSILIYHLRSVHNQAPYSCQSCGQNFSEIDEALVHFDEVSSVENSSSQCALEEGSKCLKSNLRAFITPIYPESMIRSSPTRIQTIDCDICPFKGTHSEMIDHKQGHLIPKGFINYKCVFCSWYAKKKCTIEKHMELHTKEPQRYMTTVERNLITPVAFPRNTVYSGINFPSAEFNELKDCSKAAEQALQASTLLGNELRIPNPNELKLYPFMKPNAEYLSPNDNKTNVNPVELPLIMPYVQMFSSDALRSNLAYNYEMLMDTLNRRSNSNNVYQLDNSQINQRELLFQYFLALAAGNAKYFRNSKLSVSPERTSEEQTEGSDEADDRIDIEAV